MKIIFKFVFVLCLLAAIRGEEPADKKDEPKDKATDPPKTTTASTTTEQQKKEEPPSTTPSTTTTSTTTEKPKKDETPSTTTTAAPTAAPTPAVTPAVVNNQAYPQYSPYGFYPGFYPGFAQPQVVPNLGVRINLDSEPTEASSKVPQDAQSPVQSYAGVFPLRQNPFPNNPFLGQFPGRGVSAYSGTFSG